MSGDFEECGGGRFRRPRGTGLLTQRLVQLGHLGVVPACCLGLVAATKHRIEKSVKVFTLLPSHPRPRVLLPN